MGSERINLHDTMQSALVKMADGNPGAVNVLLQLLQSDHVDPDNIMGGFGVVLSLDSHGIYGTDIYVLYNDICGGDIVKMIAVLRAAQLGFFDHNILKGACHRQDRSGRGLVPVDELYAKVKKHLPNFNS